MRFLLSYHKIIFLQRGFRNKVFSSLNQKQAIGRPFVPARKAGKLPGSCITTEYALEYGVDKLQIQETFYSSKNLNLLFFV